MPFKSKKPQKLKFNYLQIQINRELLDLTIPALARLSGLSSVQLREWESGKATKISLSSALGLCGALQMKLSNLVPNWIETAELDVEFDEISDYDWKSKKHKKKRQHALSNWGEEDALEELA